MSLYIEKFVSLEDWGVPGGASGEEPTVNAGDIREAGSIPGLGRSPGEGNDNTLQYSCLGNSMDRDFAGTVHGDAKKPDMTWRLNNNNYRWISFFSLFTSTGFRKWKGTVTLPGVCHILTAFISQQLNDLCSDLFPSLI